MLRNVFLAACKVITQQGRGYDRAWKNAYGESVSPIGFALPKPDEKAASEATAAVESEKSDVTETEADHASSMSEPEFPDLTITRMEPVRDEDSSDFEFTPIWFICPLRRLT